MDEAGTVGEGVERGRLLVQTQLSQNVKLFSPLIEIYQFHVPTVP